jgi:sec-independent protein translocase protein TatB
LFDSVGWGEILVLVVAALFILGPERLPSAAAWLGRTIKQVREYATGAQTKLRDELGPEFDELRKPLNDLRGLRNVNPRTTVRRTLFENDADPLGMNDMRGTPDTTGNDSNGVSEPGGRGSTGFVDLPTTKPVEHPAPKEPPPIDPDGT